LEAAKVEGNCQADFLQNIEDKEVTRCLHQLRVQGYPARDVVNAVDMLSDTVLYDLKVLHNAYQRILDDRAKKTKRGSAGMSQRSKHTSSSKGASNSALRRATGAEQLRDIGRQLDGDTKQHCRTLGIPHYKVQDPGRKNKMMQKMTVKVQLPEGQASETWRSSERRRTPVRTSDVRRSTSVIPSRTEMVSAFRSDLHGLFSHSRAKAEFTFDPTEDVLERLAEFLVLHAGTLRNALTAMDHDERGRLDFHDWESGLDVIGASCAAHSAWKQMNPKGLNDLTLQVLEDNLKGGGMQVTQALFKQTLQKRESAQQTSRGLSRAFSRSRTKVSLDRASTQTFTT
jgi:hypothetical protein